MKKYYKHNIFMIVTENNIHLLPESEQQRVKSLLIELKHIGKNLSLDWQDYHNDYSPERTDPCPDYYGCYRIHNENYMPVGLEMDIETLDDVICALSDFVDLI